MFTGISQTDTDVSQQQTAYYNSVDVTSDEDDATKNCKFHQSPENAKANAQAPSPGNAASASGASTEAHADQDPTSLSHSQTWPLAVKQNTTQYNAHPSIGLNNKAGDTDMASEIAADSYCYCTLNHSKTPRDRNCMDIIEDRNYVETEWTNTNWAKKDTTQNFGFQQLNKNSQGSQVHVRGLSSQANPCIFHTTISSSSSAKPSPSSGLKPKHKKRRYNGAPVHDADYIPEEYNRKDVFPENQSIIVENFPEDQNIIIDTFPEVRNRMNYTTVNMCHCSRDYSSGLAYSDHNRIYGAVAANAYYIHADSEDNSHSDRSMVPHSFSLRREESAPFAEEYHAYGSVSYSHANAVHHAVPLRDFGRTRQGQTPSFNFDRRNNYFQGLGESHVNPIFALEKYDSVTRAAKNPHHTGSVASSIHNHTHHTMNPTAPPKAATNIPKRPRPTMGSRIPGKTVTGHLTDFIQVRSTMCHRIPASRNVTSYSHGSDSNIQALTVDKANHAYRYDRRIPIHSSIPNISRSISFMN